MLKTVCLFNARPGIDTEQFRRDALEHHVRHTLEAAGDYLAGYVINCARSAFGTPMSFSFMVELWFENSTDRARFLERTEHANDGFDAQVVDMEVIDFEENVSKPPNWDLKHFAS